MTPQEAIKILKEEHDWAQQLSYVNKALNMGIEALEKQIPKKPLDICTPVVTWGLCPICKGELNKLGNQPNRIFKGTKHCSDCGQALDWSDSNETD